MRSASQYCCLYLSYSLSEVVSVTFFFRALLLSMARQVSTVIYSFLFFCLQPRQALLVWYRLLCYSEMLPHGVDLACVRCCRFSASASARNLFFSWRVKLPFALGSFSFVTSNCYCLTISPQLQFQSCRYKMVVTADISFTSDPDSDLLEVLLIIWWSIWFLSFPLGEHKVSLWISWCGKSVPWMTGSPGV